MWWTSGTRQSASCEGNRPDSGLYYLSPPTSYLVYVDKHCSHGVNISVETWNIENLSDKVEEGVRSEENFQWTLLVQEVTGEGGHLGGEAIRRRETCPDLTLVSRRRLLTWSLPWLLSQSDSVK